MLKLSVKIQKINTIRNWNIEKNREIFFTNLTLVSELLIVNEITINIISHKKNEKYNEKYNENIIMKNLII